jgi:hypothetical protein
MILLYHNKLMNYICLHVGEVTENQKLNLVVGMVHLLMEVLMEAAL